MRRATVLATAVLALGSLGVPAMAVAPGDVPDEGAAAVDRVNGDTRYDTAALTALRTYPDGADTVIVATGEKFPDALAASYLSGNEDVDAPILLTRRSEIPQATLDAMDELDPSRVVVMGETDAIASEVVDALRDRVGDDNVDVIGGATRRETAAKIALQGGAVGTAPNLTDSEGEDLTTAIVARADEFPDALASGPLALAGRHPILLTDTDSLPEVTIDALTDGDLGIEQVIVTGGPVAISEDVEEQIRDLDNIQSVARVEGDNRTGTAVALAELTRTALGWDGSDIALARGDNFPDALTLAPLAAQTESSLFLSRTPETIEGDTFAGIQALCGSTENLLIAGGPVAISADAEGEATLATICADQAFPITADQEPQGGKDGAAGTGWVVVDGDTVCTTYDVEGLENQADASHIHQGVAGASGDPVIDLGTPNADGFLSTCTTDADVAQGIATEPFGYYVNVHTPEFALGAARGQLDGTQDLRVQLSGENEVQEDGSFVDEPAAGQATLDLTFGDGELCYDLSVSGLDSAVDPSTGGGLHIHEGAVNANGDVVLPLPQSQSATDYTARDCVTVDQDTLDAIQTDPSAYYANLHTVEASNGALRGQLGADADTTAFGAAVVDDSDPANPDFGGGTEGLTVPVKLYWPEAGTVCVDATLPEDAGSLDGITLKSGQVDENDDNAAGDVTFASAHECQTGLDAAITELLGASPAAQYVSVEIGGTEAARGQVAADQDTMVTPAADGGDITAMGTVALYDGADSDVLCGMVDVHGADGIDAVDVTADDDSAVASLGITEPLGFGCETEAADTDAAAVTVTTDGGTLAGEFA